MAETKLNLRRAAWIDTDAGWSVERREGEDVLHVYWVGRKVGLIPGDNAEGVPEDVAHALAVAIMAALNANLGPEGEKG